MRQCMLLGGAGLITGAACAFDAWWGRPTRRLARAHKWAREQVASYEDEWLVPFQEQSVVARLMAGVAGFLALVLLFEAPLGGQPYAAVLLAFPSVYGSCADWLAPEPRSHQVHGSRGSASWGSWTTSLSARGSSCGSQAWSDALPA